MPDPAVRVESLSKEYVLGHPEERPDTFREMLAGAITSPLRRLRQLRGDVSDAERFWALRDVSFDVHPGEVVGIIGRNGAGKSTLLKILSRITAPTCGRVTIGGRVSSLLEVGTGFHPELTGRENIFLNAAILGMSRQEVLGRFDEIVSFAETGRFLDTPVKRYSSGMYVRLAFSVAAHLEPEILIVDEVLAVGDAAFQAKCLGKIGEVARGGRTVLFVSHNLRAVGEFCNRAIWLHEGEVRLQAEPREAIQAYLGLDTAASGRWARPVGTASSGAVDLLWARVTDEHHVETAVVSADRVWLLEIGYRVCVAIHDTVIFARFVAADGTVVFASWDVDSETTGQQVRKPGSYRTMCKVPPQLLRPGTYSVTVGAYRIKGALLDIWHAALSVEVSRLGYRLNDERLGIITPILEWSTTLDD